MPCWSSMAFPPSTALPAPFGVGGAIPVARRPYRAVPSSQTGRRGDVTPMHVQSTDAEVFYVLDGGITAWAGEDVHELDAGDAIHCAQRTGAPHALPLSLGLNDFGDFLAKRLPTAAAPRLPDHRLGRAGTIFPTVRRTLSGPGRSSAAPG
jgi:hypothetical protein